MNCWSLLDLPEDADERSIRRRYAQLLKVHRPDEDPAAFQRLREAYERALQLARWRAERAPEEPPAVDREPPAPVTPAEGVEAVSLPAELAERIVEAVLPGPLAPELPPLQRMPPGQPQTQAEEQAPPHWFADAEDEALEKALADAQASGRRALFERALLHECLADRADAPALTRWALRRLHWFELGQRSELPLLAMNALAARLAARAIDELAADLRAGQERMFLECLRMLLATGWLQGFDRRAQFHQALAWLLLETPGWSDAFFAAVCDLCGWNESSLAEPEQWQTLVERAEEFAYARRLRGFLDSARPLDAEQKAVWLLLKPMPEKERERFKLGLTEDDWAAYALLCDRLRYRYPALWEGWGCGEPEQPSDPAPSGDGWRYTGVALYLLLLAALLVHGAGRGLFDDSLAPAIPLAVVAALASAFLGWVMRGWGVLSDALVGLDVRLSRWVLLDTWVDGRRGLLLIRHLLPCAVLAWLIAAPLDLAREDVAALWLLVFAGGGVYSLLAVRGYSLAEIALALLVKGLSGLFGKLLLGLILVAALAALAISQADRPGAGGLHEPASEQATDRACADESCQRWSAVKDSLLELARAKRAAEQARASEAGAAP